MTRSTDPRPGQTVFHQGSGLVDGVHPGSRAGVGVLIRDGRVLEVGTRDRLCSQDTLVVDHGPHVLIPGLVDAHTHITIRPGEGGQHEQLQAPPAWQTVRGVANLRAMLASGVTTARIMTEEHAIDVHFRRASAAGEVPAPRLLVAGRGLSPPGGHGGSVHGVAGVDDLRAAVRANAELGVDHIKIFTTGGVSSTDSSLEQSNYSRAEIDAIVDEAARHGLTVSAHAHGGDGVRLAVLAGVHSIEHGALLTQELVDLMVEHGTRLVLTSSILFHPTAIEQGDARDPAILAKVQQARAAMERTVVRVREAGVPVAVGTDSMHGLIDYEAQWMVEHGWSPEQALHAATRGGADVLRRTDVGVLRPGAIADLVVLRADPVHDVRALAEVVEVYQDGVRTVDEHGFFRPRQPAERTPQEEAP